MLDFATAAGHPIHSASPGSIAERDNCPSSAFVPFALLLFGIESASTDLGMVFFARTTSAFCHWRCLSLSLEAPKALAERIRYWKANYILIFVSKKVFQTRCVHHCV